MKKILAMVLTMVMMACLAGSAFAIVLPEHLDSDPSNDPVIGESDASETVPAEPEDYFIDFTPYIGASSEELSAFLKEEGLDGSYVTAKTANYTDADGESKFGVNLIRFEKSGIGALGFSMYGKFEGEITPEMEAEGWSMPRKQFEGGYFYVTLEKAVKDCVYTASMTLDGDKIISLQVEVNDLNAHFAAISAEEVQE